LSSAAWAASLKRPAPYALQLKNGGDVKRKALLDRFVGAWNAHDLDGIMASLTDDCAFWSSSGAHPQGGVSKTGKR
jgi:ketosteroid isomerase-like protein